MKIYKNQIVSAVLAIIFSIPILFGGISLASTGISHNKLFDLQSFGIIDGDEVGDLALDANLTRAEFCKIATKLMRLDESIYSITLYYEDVPESHWATKYISVLTEIGLVNGDADRNFYPDEAITFNQTLKILVRVLGYGDEAERSGSYPSGYIITGSTIRLLKGITASGENFISRAVAFDMVYNALDVPILDGAARLQATSNTLRNILMGDETEGLILYRGVVTANYETWLSSSVSSMKENDVEIDGMLFDKGDTNADLFLGQEVEVYIGVDPDYHKHRIIGIKPTRNTRVLELSFDEIDSISDYSISYHTPEDSRTLSERISENPIVLYNGRMVNGLSDVDILSMKDGSVKLISNNGSTSFDVIFVNEYQSFRVDRISADELKIFLADNKSLNEQRVLALDETQSIIYRIIDADKGYVEIDTLVKGDLISVFVSRDKKLIKIMTALKYAEGVVAEVNESENRIILDDMPYKVEKGVALSNVIGKKVFAIVNFEGKIAYIDQKDATKNYAAVIKTIRSSSLGDYNLVLVIPDYLTVDLEVLDYDADRYDTSEIPSITGKNRAVREITLANQIIFEGQRYSAKSLFTQLEHTINSLSSERRYFAISYDLNADGKISRIELPKVYKEGNNRYYNAYEKTFSDREFNAMIPTVRGAFGLSDNTLGLCIPLNPVAGSVDYYAYITMNNDEEYFIEAYDFNEDTKCPDLVLMFREFSFATTGNTNKGSRVGLVNRVSTVIDEEEKHTLRISTINSEGETDFLVSHDTSAINASRFASLKSGDLIRYSTDWRGNMDGCFVLESANPIPYPIDKRNVQSAASDNNYIFIGEIDDVTYNDVSFALNRWVDVVTVTARVYPGDIGVSVRYHIQHRNPPPIFIYNSRLDTAKLGSPDDLSSSHKRVIFHASGNIRGVPDLRAIVIII